jgi:hypothetical protein
MAPPLPPAKRLRSSSALVGPRRRLMANAVVAGSCTAVSAPAAKIPPPGSLPSASATATQNAEAGQLSLGFSQRDTYLALA